MSPKAYLKASPAALIAGLIVTAVFLIFGVVFLTVLAREGAGIGVAFMAVWIIVVLVIGGFCIYNLLNYKNDAKNTAGEIVLDGSVSGGGFDEKLRKLEGLKKDGLVNDEEYRQKRAQIMEEKW